MRPGSGDPIPFTQGLLSLCYVLGSVVGALRRAWFFKELIHTNSTYPGAAAFEAQAARSMEGAVSDSCEEQGMDRIG